MLSKYGMANCKPILMPLDVNAKLSAQVGDVKEDVIMYNKIVGSLIYLTITRPDLSYTVGLESQFMQLPRKPHLDALRRTLRYVRLTLDYALFYAADDVIVLCFDLKVCGWMLRTCSGVAMSMVTGNLKPI